MMLNVPCCSSAGIYLPCGYTLQHVYSSCIYIIYIYTSTCPRVVGPEVLTHEGSV